MTSRSLLPINTSRTLVWCLHLVVGAPLCTWVLHGTSSTQAWAQEGSDRAEAVRLNEEIRKLAQKNAWAGVERNFQARAKLKTPIEIGTYLLGAESARQIGKTKEWLERLTEANTQADAAQGTSELAGLQQKIEQVKTNIAAIERSYGRISIIGNPKFRPTLVEAVTPFVPDERKSIEWAQTVMAETGSFDGLLPVGDYTAGSQSFAVIAGPKVQEIRLKRDKADRAIGFIEYHGLVATLGYNYMITGMPGQSDAADEVQPGSVRGSGIALDVGYELGFSPYFGVALTAGYSGLYSGNTSTPSSSERDGFTNGSSTFHTLQGWLAAAFRPGKTRIAVGPTYAYRYGSGTGVADWYDPATPPGDFEDGDATKWKGTSLAPGAALSVGYGVLSLGKLRGIIEADLGWSYDGRRHYTQFGIRVGVVPLIRRFKE